MKPKFKDYMSKLSVPLSLEEKIIEIIEFYENNFNFKVEDIFISEYLKGDGTREFENLWLFTDEYACEAKQFAIKDDFDFVIIKNRIKYWNIKKDNYDFKQQNEKSKFTLEVILSSRMDILIQSTKENCNYLRDIFFKYYFPNMQRIINNID